jgi:Protein of unknown function (DUF1778)
MIDREDQHAVNSSDPLEWTAFELDLEQSQRLAEVLLDPPAPNEALRELLARIRALGLPEGYLRSGAP